MLLMDRGHDGALLNVGCGEGATIAQLAQTVMRVLGFDGRIAFNATKPDGTPRKLLVCAV